MEEKEITSCPHDPKQTTGPIGMYHCPYCGAMVLAGLKHPTDEDVRFTGIPAYGDINEDSNS